MSFFYEVMIKIKHEKWEKYSREKLDLGNNVNH
jgi:hypothetical protein